MKWTGLNELREMYLQFFESKQHLRLASFPLVPVGDKSLLLINSGMAPMKKWFLGEEEPPSQRVTTCQKCIRTPDIESVGITARHGTFFEMLGNFSFQDYFKKEAIAWAWEFLTAEEWLAIPAEKLHISVYEEDNEAYEIWTKEIGIDPSHMVRLGKADNFWEHGNGPCGPCSEIHFDRGVENGCGKESCGKESCGVGCDCDRFMEVWNLVFTEFDSDGKGNYTKLPKPNIDTGMGLERLACVLQGAPNLFETDTVKSILQHVEKLSGKQYGKNRLGDISMRVVADHIRSTVFMVGDGVLPSNEGRGYVLRRLLRRAARHGHLLGIRRPFLSEVCETVIEQNKTAYPELAENAAYIQKIISTEEDRFRRTIEQGLSRLNEIMENMAKLSLEAGARVISGLEAFRLNDTFGFPLDLTREIAAEAGIDVDVKAFKAELQKQRQKARDDRKSREIAGWEADLFASSTTDATVFVGYDTLQQETKVVELSDGVELVEAVATDDGEKDGVLVVLQSTPFYAEGGGQVADTGVLSGAGVSLAVRHVQKTGKGYFVHVCTLQTGSLRVGDVLTAKVDEERRKSIMRNHTSAHLLQQALRQVLGEHVHQSGSYVDDERVRFDFTHFSALLPAEIKKVEDEVNRQVFAGLVVNAQNMSKEQAKQKGAMALFGEKYGDEVRVVDAGGWAVELCGGTHVSNTSQLGSFKIISESSVAAGVRRIEATTGYGVLRLIDEKEELLHNVAQVMKVANIYDLTLRAATLVGEGRDLQKELEAMKAKVSAQKVSLLFGAAVDVDGVKVFTQFMPSTPPAELRQMCDMLRDKEPECVAALAGEFDGKLTLAVGCGKPAMARGLKAGMLAKETAAIAGGSGGGKPDFAMAGMKNKDKVEEALAGVPNLVRKMLQG